LIFWSVLPPGYLKLNLTAQRDGMDGFIFHGVGHAELEQKSRCNREALRFGLLDLEA
jgi:hypothetical protein